MAERISAESRLLAGFYDPQKRSDQVLRKLEKELERFRGLDFTRDIAEQLNDTSDFQKEKSLESLQEEIRQLINEVEAYQFPGRHFTKQYRTFQGGCDKLLQHLDSISIGDDRTKRQQKGQLIEEVQKIVATINSKVHRDGNCCTNCELYGTMWQ